MKWKWKSLSPVWLFATPWTIQSVEFSRPEYCNGEPFPSPGDLPNPGIKPRSPALQVKSLTTKPQWSPRMLERVAYPFSRGSSWPRNQTWVSFIAGGFFTNWAIREATLLDKAQAYDREQHREVTYSKEEREDEEEWERKVRAITD